MKKCNIHCRNTIFLEKNLERIFSINGEFIGNFKVFYKIELSTSKLNDVTDLIYRYKDFL
jgi:hypothetical protein